MATLDRMSSTGNARDEAARGDEPASKAPPRAVVGDAWSAGLVNDNGADPVFLDEFAAPPAGATPPKRRLHPRDWTPLTWVLVSLLVVGLQAPLIWIFAAASHGEGPLIFNCLDLDGPRKGLLPELERIRLEVRCKPGESVETFLTAPSPPIPPDAQLVEVPDQPEAVDPKPVDTKYLADKTTRTEKETRAEPAAKAEKAPAGAPMKDPIKDPSKTRSEASKSREPSKTPEPPDKAPRIDTIQEAEPSDKRGDGGSENPQLASILDMPKGDGGTVPPAPTDMRKGSGGPAERLLAPVGTEKGALANLQALAGEMGSNDHLPDLERGKSTVLNANAYKYADFFQTVKRAVERQWKPNETYTKRDPTGQVYGVKDRYSVLRVELDRKGNLVNLITVRASGLDFMDEEAKRAFRAAAPFPNPPIGLADADGRIRFEFGFYFEITAGKYQFDWRRL